MTQYAIGETSVSGKSSLYEPSLYSMLLLRLVFGLIPLFGAIISFLALSWDVQWHVFVGRDRTLTAPHIMILSGIVISGISTLLAVLTETIWMRRNPAMAQYSTPFAGIFAAPLGAYIAGYASLNSAVAFPMDQYWHTLYGIDVAIWAPFHIMAISGLALTALGVAYTLASVTNLAMGLHAVRVKWVASLGMIVALAISFASFMVIVFSGISPTTFIKLGITSISLFPLLSGLLLGSLLGAMVYAAPWKWAATSVVGVAFVFVGIDQLAVPPAMTWLMQVEQLTYLSIQRATPPQISVIAIQWPLLSLVTAILIDICIQRAQEYKWPKRQLSLAIAGAIFIGCMPLTIRSPGAALRMVTSMNILGVLLTLVTCCVGIFVGQKIGEMIGKTMGTSER